MDKERRRKRDGDGEEEGERQEREREKKRTRFYHVEEANDSRAVCENGDNMPPILRDRK